MKLVTNYNAGRQNRVISNHLILKLRFQKRLQRALAPSFHLVIAVITNVIIMDTKYTGIAINKKRSMTESAILESVCRMSK